MTTSPKLPCRSKSNRSLPIIKERSYELYHSFVLLWCGRQDLNLHALRHMSLNHTCLPIPPRPHIFNYLYRITLYEPKSYVSSCCGARHSLRLTKQARALPTAATRSARLFRHRRRSHRSPIPPRPRIFYRQRKYFTMTEGNCQRNLRLYRTFLQ